MKQITEHINPLGFSPICHILHDKAFYNIEVEVKQSYSMKYIIKITETISVETNICFVLFFCFICCYLCMFILFLQDNLYQWLYFINILSYGCVYSVYAFDVVCDNK